ncbi:hypothetical protein K470DRAFT_199843, partial [Piedraia hortae CBS 480.64]
MSEKSKTLSLRRRKTARHQISARQISAPRENQNLGQLRPSTSHLPVPGENGRPNINGDKTSNLVMRRYSTRFTGQPMPYFGDTNEPVPALPSTFTQRGLSPDTRDRSRDRSRSGERKSRIDMRALNDPKLNAEEYVQSVLADASAGDIRAYQNELQTVKGHTNADLQRSVYKNRTQFIKISKEADRLKSEMRILRSLMSELPGVLAHTANAASDTEGLTSTMSLADRKRANRSSVANLEALWSSQLQVLWKRVEGSQKFLPAVPGRHIIAESQRWVELNAATWKTRRRVALVLLNTNLLVASEKKRNDLLQSTPNSKGSRMSMFYSPGASSLHGSNHGQSSPSPAAPTTFVAERCWALQDVSLADISSSASREQASMGNAINLRVGNESFTYATPDTAEKASLVVAFRKAQEDLRKQLAEEHRKRESQLDEITSNVDRLKPLGEAAPRDTTLHRRNSVLIDVDGRQQTLRWVEGQIDSLDIDIALQRFSDAVSRTEKLRKLARNIKGNASAQEEILASINSRAAKLASNISRQLVLNSGGMERTAENVSWLLRLGFDNLARKTYLDARMETIRLRARTLPFTGALVPYIRALAYTVFNLILMTFRTYNRSFPPVCASGVVKWALERVEEFNQDLKRQLKGVERDSEVWKLCAEGVREQVGCLNEVAVDFGGLVEKGL